MICDYCGYENKHTPLNNSLNIVEMRLLEEENKRLRQQLKDEKQSQKKRAETHKKKQDKALLEVEFAQKMLRHVEHESRIRDAENNADNEKLEKQLEMSKTLVKCAQTQRNDIESELQNALRLNNELMLGQSALIERIEELKREIRKMKIK
jgi:hypothetical protein